MTHGASREDVSQRWHEYINRFKQEDEISNRSLMTSSGLEDPCIRHQQKGLEFTACFKGMKLDLQGL